MAELVLRALRGNSTSLNLTNKQLQQVPIAVIKLKALRTLRISNNYLIDLPPEIKTLRELTELNLGNNAFQHVPEVLFHMISLQKLQLYGNLISEITSGLFGLENLVFLNLSQNQLRSLPEEIYRLARLEYLNVSNNELESIPVKLCLLQQLRELHLAYNKIKSFPPEIKYLTNLRKLCVPRNQLEDLPEKLCFLRKLKLLDVAGNHLHIFPSRLMDLPLAELYFEQNPLLTKHFVVTVQQEEVLRLKYSTKPQNSKYLNYPEKYKPSFGIAVPLNDSPVTVGKCLILVWNLALPYNSTANTVWGNCGKNPYGNTNALYHPEIAARYIMKELRDTSSYTYAAIKYYPAIRKMLDDSNTCAICGESLLNTWLECVDFVKVKRMIKQSGVTPIIPVRVFLCSYNCFNSPDHHYYGVAV
ncbi:leucine-rich repeat-containing protein 69 [Callorhinchus milii]|uniref:leucine-rich repeat-containing protein 69 n=1 Tax=Callorhinchus milii TaxID=7868 RepID=UPI001C3F64DF|nr:leucine-rich repeat-containing protein 69 [Callorhinchus milii]